MKVTPTQKQVLRQLIFAETFDVIKNECGLMRGELRDDLTQLIHAGLIEVFDIDGAKRVLSYDSDNLELFSFRASKQGLSHIR